MHAAAPLPSDPAVLQEEVIRLQGRLAEVESQCSEQQRTLDRHLQLIDERDRRIEQLLDLIAILKRKRFGQSADRLNLDAAQLNLFDEAELEALLAELEAELEKERAAAPAADGDSPAEAPAPAPKAQPKRRALPAHLPRIERILDLPEERKVALDGQWSLIGYETSEQLGVIPRQFYVIVYKRAKYAPCDDTVPGAAQGILIAPRAPQLLPKPIADSSLLAEAVAGKFIDALPLYRQERRFAAEGLDIPRQTQAGWPIETAERLAPIAAGMRRELYRGRVLRIDETRLQGCCASRDGPIPTSPSCGSSAAGRPGERSSSSITANRARARYRCAFSSRPGGRPMRRPRSADGYSRPTATRATTRSPSYLASLRMPAAGRTCGANSSRPAKGASTPRPPTRRWPRSPSSTPWNVRCAIVPPRSAAASASARAVPSSRPSTDGSTRRPPACCPRARSARPSAMRSTNGTACSFSSTTASSRWPRS